MNLEEIARIRTEEMIRAEAERRYKKAKGAPPPPPPREEPVLERFKRALACGLSEKTLAAMFDRGPEWVRLMKDYIGSRSQ